MQINRISGFSCAVLLLLFFHGLAHAASSGAAVRVQTGYIAYAFEQKAFTTLDEATLASLSLSKQQLEDTLPFLGIGATLFFGDFYFDLYGQSSFSGSDSSVLLGNTIEPDGGGSFNYVPFRRPIDSDWDRTEYSLTVGYAVTRQFKLFTGFRGSETSFDLTGTSTNLQNDFTLPFTVDIDYSQNGFFVGGNYAWSINENKPESWLRGAISINAGLTFVDGEIDEKFAFEGFDPVNSKREGDTLGLVVGIAWNGYLGKMFANDFYYTAGVNSYRYDFEADNPSVDADFSERVLQFTLGLSMPITF